MPARAPPPPAQPAGKNRRRRYRRAGGRSFPPGLAGEGHPLPRGGLRGPPGGCTRGPAAPGLSGQRALRPSPSVPRGGRRGRAALSGRGGVKPRSAPFAEAPLARLAPPRLERGAGPRRGRARSRAALSFGGVVPLLAAAPGGVAAPRSCGVQRGRSRRRGLGRLQCGRS